MYGITIFFLIFGLLVGYLVGRGIRQEVRGYNGATEWKEHMWCQKCETAYPQYGLHASVYNCPGCGEKTGYAMARYNQGELEVKRR